MFSGIIHCHLCASVSLSQHREHSVYGCFFQQSARSGERSGQSGSTSIHGQVSTVYHLKYSALIITLIVYD